ncbi:Fic family protein [Pseudarthrobacter sp. NPDC092419]|uniref:Fic family protein n=1 Tax=Pseudarthrobacter sp. NPDC092419 TaxID=3364414 RepID=UPI00380D1216
MKAAALLESVARFHPLIDGNKRTARTLMVLLLWINGYRHDFTTDEGFDLVAIARYPSAITLAVSTAKWSSVSFELAQPMVRRLFAEARRAPRADALDTFVPLGKHCHDESKLSALQRANLRQIFEPLNIRCSSSASKSLVTDNLVGRAASERKRGRHPGRACLPRTRDQ